MNKFNRWDKVFSKKFGEGKVLGFDNINTSYPVLVVFNKSQVIRNYSHSGEYNIKKKDPDKNIVKLT